MLSQHSRQGRTKRLWTISVLMGALVFAFMVSWAANAQAEPLIPGLEIEPDYDVMSEPGETLTFEHTVQNTQDVSDTFLLQVDSDLGWPVMLVGAPPTNTMQLNLTLEAQETATIEVEVTVPNDAVGTQDEITITGVSLSNPAIVDAAIDTVTVETRLYLAVVFNWYPPVPFAPVLNAISNADQDGYYTVSWQAADLAQTYSLEEDDNASFTSPTVVYSGSGTSWTVPAPGKNAGTFYYRVRGSNSYGFGPYSNTESTTVANLFYADVTSLVAGNCTTLRWNFTNIKGLYVSFAYGFDKRGVAGVGTATVCPSVTTTFEALVVKQDNSQELHEFTINVTGSTCGDPYVQRFEPTTYSARLGEKFSIFWDVECAQAIYLSIGSAAEVPVQGHDSRVDLTITQDTLFKLRIVFLRGQSDNASFTVTLKK